MDITEAVGKFIEGPSAVALGPSSLESVANEELQPGVAVAIPANLLRLLSLVRGGSDEHRAFLIRVLRYFRSRPWGPTPRDVDDNLLVDRIIELIDEFERQGRLIVIDQNFVDPEIQRALENLYSGRAFEISLSPRRNFLRDYLVSIYSWSRATGGTVLERTRRVFSDMGHHIAALQLPDKLDHYVNLKGHYVGRMFGFPGGKAAKFFVGCAVSAAGLHSPAASIAGVVIAFVDP